MACSNRVERTAVIGKTEFTLRIRNTREPDHFSREECYEMLRSVRRMENLSGWRGGDYWKCPEPEAYEIALSARWNNPNNSRK